VAKLTWENLTWLADVARFLVDDVTLNVAMSALSNGGLGLNKKNKV